jgi:hypothetical protein
MGSAISSGTYAKPVKAKLGVNSNHWFASWGKPQWVVGTAEEIAKTQRRSDAGRWAPVRTSTAAPPLRC